MIDIRPDPAHPQGGHAVLVLASDAVTGDSVPVSVRDNYSGRFLGENGFQATKVAFGPYPVQRSGAQAEIVIGPEIVNQIEEYTAVHVTVGDTGADVSWPDSVVPAPGAPALGGIYRAPEAEDAPLSGTRAAQPQPSKPETAPDTPPPPPPPTDTQAEIADPAPKSRLPLILGGLAVLLIAAAAAYFLLKPEEPAPVPDPEPVVTAPTVPEPAPADPCETATLDALAAEGFSGLAARLRDCTATVSADDALLYMERAAAQGDPAALLLFGQLYDDQQTDQALETQMGLTFGDAPDRAADYYSRAVEAGSQEAETFLDEVCARLADRSDTLSQGAFADFCGPE